MKYLQTLSVLAKNYSLIPSKKDLFINKKVEISFFIEGLKINLKLFLKNRITIKKEQ